MPKGFLLLGHLFPGVLARKEQAFLGAFPPPPACPTHLVPVSGSMLRASQEACHGYMGGKRKQGAHLCVVLRVPKCLGCRLSSLYLFRAFLSLYVLLCLGFLLVCF